MSGKICGKTLSIGDRFLYATTLKQIYIPTSLRGFAVGLIGGSRSDLVI